MYGTVSVRCPRAVRDALRLCDGAVYELHVHFRDPQRLYGSLREGLRRRLRAVEALVDEGQGGGDARPEQRVLLGHLVAQRLQLRADALQLLNLVAWDGDVLLHKPATPAGFWRRRVKGNARERRRGNLWRRRPLLRFKLLWAELELELGELSARRRLGDACSAERKATQRRQVDHEANLADARGRPRSGLSAG